jgi:hypothetical protein
VALRARISEHFCRKFLGAKLTISAKICTQHQWVDKIEKLIPGIAPLNLRRSRDCPYVEIVNGDHVFNDADAFNLSNSSEHDDLIQRAVSLLRQKAGDAVAKHLLGELTFRKTYGAFSEMAAYDWMARAGIDFTPQVVLGPADVVNPNGSTLDGSFQANSRTVFFDIKGFGFVDHKVEILKRRLEENADGDEVLVQGGVSVSIDFIQDLLERPGFDLLLQELSSKSSAARGTLTFVKRPRPQVSIGVNELDPTRLAAENREYALRFGSQFARREPFMLFFVIHPWFSQGPLHQNFEQHTDNFCTELARVTFLSFDHDHTIREGLPTHELVRLLSAIAFINVWPQPSSQGAGPTARLYLNPNALHPVEQPDLDFLQQRLGAQISITQM